MSTPILTDIEVDDFVIIRAVAFANKIQRVMLRDVLSEHDMPVLEWRSCSALRGSEIAI